MHESKKITVVLAASKLTVKRKQRIDRKRKFVRKLEKFIILPSLLTRGSFIV